MNRKRIAAAVCGAVAIIATFSVVTRAYQTNPYKWASFPVPVYVNANNSDVPASAAIAALQSAMNEWNSAGTMLRYSYAGQVNDTSTSVDGRNVIIFRNASNPDSPSAVATTYSWASGGVRVDADIVFWDGKYQFFTGTSGCSGINAYIEDIATHELGHALGLLHSGVNEATMYSTYMACSTWMRTLGADDIAGVKHLYGTSTTTNTSPVVSIAAPSNGASVTYGTSSTFTGSASDSQDGPLTGNLTWVSSLDGVLGNGTGFSRVLNVGSHTITASVTDSGGMSGSRSVSMTVNVEPPPPDPDVNPFTLSTNKFKTRGYQSVGLRWSGATATNVDIYRNGAKVVTTPNDKEYVDNLNVKGSATYTYKLCEAGSTTCSNQATATF